MTFTIEKFIADCISAGRESESSRAIREVVRSAIDNPAAVEKAFGQPVRAGFQRLYVSGELTILNVVWAPRMTLMPHNHNMWAVIGVHSGREDNIFWRRLPGAPAGLIEAAGAKSIGRGEVRPLGETIIHSVTNPTAKFTSAIHVYGGNFFEAERSQWDPESLEEQPYDFEKNVEVFEQANAGLGIE